MTTLTFRAIVGTIAEDNLVESNIRDRIHYIDGMQRTIRCPFHQDRSARTTDVENKWQDLSTQSGTCLSNTDHACTGLANHKLLTDRPTHGTNNAKMLLGIELPSYYDQISIHYYWYIFDSFG
jgi:hypothetical protein